MEELQRRLRELEAQKSVMFESGAADQVEVGRINAEIRAIESQIGRQVTQEEKIAEVDGMELPYDFDTEFGLEGVNKLVRSMLKDERTANFADFDAEYERLLTEYSEKLKGVEERELQLVRQNDYLNVEVERLAGDAQNETRRASELKEFVEMQKVTIAEKDTIIYNLNQRNEEIETNRRNAANQLEEAQAEILRLEDQLDEMRRANVFGERKAQQIIDVTPTTNELYEQAKRATAAKRQVIITGQVGANFSTVQNPDGSSDVIHVSQIGSEVEVVESFLPIPETPGIDEFITSGAHTSIPEQDEVHGRSGDACKGDQDQAESYLPANESTEAAQETAHSEEVGEAIYAPIGMKLTETHDEWVTRTLNELQLEVYGERVKAAA